MGIAPDIIVPRCDAPIAEDIRHKIALFCNVKPDCVIENLTVPVLYEAPNMLERSHFSDIVCRELNLSCPPADLSEWNEMLQRIKTHGVACGSRWWENMCSCMTLISPWRRRSGMAAMKTGWR